MSPPTPGASPDGAPALLGASGPAAAREPEPEPVHGCVRCGAPVPIGTAMCERCNPLGLAEPAPSQVHGTVLLAVVVAVALLAVLGRVAIAGIGPFRAEIAGVVPEPPGLAVTLRVTNTGSNGGSTTCRVFDPTVTGIGPESAYVESPRIEPGQTAVFSKQVTSLGSALRPLATDCDTP
jgi:hypothetical protein